MMNANFFLSSSVFTILFSLLASPLFFQGAHHHLLVHASSTPTNLPFADKDNQDKSGGVGSDGWNQELDTSMTLIFENDDNDNKYYNSGRLTFREIDFLNKAWMASLDTVLSDKRMVALAAETIAEVQEPTTTTTSTSLSSGWNDQDSNPTQEQGDEKNKHKNNKNNLRRPNHRATRRRRGGRRTRYRQRVSYSCRLCYNGYYGRRHQRRDLLQSAESEGIFAKNNNKKKQKNDRGANDMDTSDETGNNESVDASEGSEGRLEELEDTVCEILRSGPYVKFHKVKKCIVSVEEP